MRVDYRNITLFKSYLIAPDVRRCVSVDDSDKLESVVRMKRAISNFVDENFDVPNSFERYMLNLIIHFPLLNENRIIK